MKVHVDPDRCMAHGMCHALAPEVFEVNEDSGYNEMGAFDAPAHLRDAVLRGFSACPERAISITDDDTAG
jgi:ferredoxin